MVVAAVVGPLALFGSAVRAQPLFSPTHWRTDTLNPFIPGVSSIWLGNDL